MAKHGYEDVGVEEIREQLKAKGVLDEDVLGQNKKALVAVLINMQLEEVEAADEIVLDDVPHEIFDAVVIPKEKAESAPLDQPAFNTEKWHEWVMTQFSDDEMAGGAPYCDGLRRVTEMIIGPISKVEVISSVPPSTDNRGNATVVIGITINHVTLEGHPSFSESIYVEDIADCNELNTPKEYLKHPSATAATRAEARAYRKILRLKKILAAEEANADQVDAVGENWTPSNPITDQQINVLDIVCKRNNMSVMDFINSGKDKYEFIEQVTEHTAQIMLQHLSRIARGDTTKPKGVGPYDYNWSTKNNDKREAVTT
jgi:hypothetical protein